VSKATRVTAQALYNDTGKG